jgi:hypothetical protein
LDFIDEHLSQVEGGGGSFEEHKLNKRAIYYHHKDKTIESTGELDQYLSEICQILRVRRADLQIVSLL